MPEEREKLARNLNAGLDAASGCAGCYIVLILLGAIPMVAVAAWALVGASTGSDWAGAVAGIAAGVGVIVVAARLTGWGR